MPLKALIYKGLGVVQPARVNLLAGDNKIAAIAK